MWFKKKKKIENVKIDEYTIRRQYHFFGEVQYVGFRARAMMHARTLGLTGWVENEEDGSVTMEIQGHREVIEQFIDYMHKERGITISEYYFETQSVDKNESEFNLIY